MSPRSNRARSSVQGELRIGGQEHFYLETQCAIAWLDEAGGVALHSSTQHPAETQEVVARVLGVPRNQVTVECLRMGGAFGGKEVQAEPSGAPSPRLGAWKTGRPVRVRLTRALDMALTGKRHPFLARYAAGLRRRRPDRRRDDRALFRRRLEPRSLRADAVARAVPQRQRLPAAGVELTGWVCRTHKTSQTAFRGFGGPQGMLVIEEILDAGSRARSACRRNWSASATSTAKARPRTTGSR